MTNDAVPVTAEAREAAVALIRKVDHRTEYLSEIQCGDYDDNFFVQAFARFERDILARHRGSTAGVEVEKIETVTGDFGTEPGEPFWRVRIGEQCADFDFELAARNFAAAIERLASLSQTPATPMDELQRLGQEYDGAVQEGPFHVSRSSDGEKHWFSARDPAAGVIIPAKDREDAYALVASLNRSCAAFALRALSPTPAQEGEQ